MIKGSCNFMGNSPSKWATIMQRLMTIGTLVVET